MRPSIPNVFLVAAEASGDNLGAGLMRALRQEASGRIRFSGVGGPAMQAEGLASPFDIKELSVLGMVEGVAAYPRVVRRADETAALAAREQPDVAVLIDSWGFTLRVAKRLRRQSPSLPLVKYVAPQVWASRPGRAKTLAAAVDRLLSIHSFDAAYFEAVGLKTTFVGNPALATDFSAADPQGLRRRLGFEASQPLVLVLPGSRPAEIKRLTPVFKAVCERLHAERPDLGFIIAAAASVREEVQQALRSWTAPIALVETDPDKRSAMRSATLALACSGTVTTELALAECPMVVAYKVGGLTWLILKLILTARYATLFNIAAGQEIAPEFLQRACAPGPILDAVRQRLDDPDLLHQQTQRQSAALRLMGQGRGDPAAEAARAVLQTLGEAPAVPGISRVDPPE